MMPKDALLTTLNYPLTIWRGESFYQFEDKGDAGRVMYHIVYSNGTSYMIVLDKENGATYIKKGEKFSLCSDCYTRDTGSLVADPANDQNCMEHVTEHFYDMHGGVFKLEDNQGPQIMFEVGSYITNQP